MIYKKLFIPENICIHYILTEQINGRTIKIMVTSLKRSLHTVLPRILKFLFELTLELLNTVFLIKVHLVDVTGFIVLKVQTTGTEIESINAS